MDNWDLRYGLSECARRVDDAQFVSMAGLWTSRCGVEYNLALNIISIAPFIGSKFGP